MAIFGIEVSNTNSRITSIITTNSEDSSSINLMHSSNLHSPNNTSN